MLFALMLALAAPADWVPARWNWTDPATLDLLEGVPVNCLLLKWDPAQSQSLSLFATRAADRKVVTLAVIGPRPDLVDAARQAMRAKMTGIVLEGDFPEGAADGVRDALADSKPVVIELSSRNRMKLGGSAPILATYQGVWPGIQVMDDGHAKAGPSGSAWIDTNSGFIRAVKAWGSTPLWIGNLPPPKAVVTGERYSQVICDAAMVGARWIIALDDDFARRLKDKDPATVKQWRRMGQHAQYYEDHKEWRAFKPAGEFALIQDVNDGALLSGGILDMIATKHTPVKPIPRQKLTGAQFKGISMAVNVDGSSLTPEQKEVLRSFTRSGGTLLTAPPGWKDNASGAQLDPTKTDQITLEKAETERLDTIWKEVNSMIGRRNLGARLFNVSTMLCDLIASPDGKEVIVQLVNFADYPVESVAVHVLGNFKRARVYTPEEGEKTVEVYKTDEGSGVDIDKISVCATLRLD
jgi:hypothetical protein